MMSAVTRSLMAGKSDWPVDDVDMSLGKTSLSQLRKLQVKQKRGVGFGDKKEGVGGDGRHTERAGDTARRTISAESRNKVLAGDLQPILRSGNHNCNQSSP